MMYLQNMLSPAQKIGFDTELKYHGKSDTRNIDHHDIPPVKCNAATDVKVTPATSGSNGAIIITW